MSELLSAALIVKNEAHFLPGCLAALTSVVDEVVVVDTGSTDDSRDLARAGGARLFEHSWTGRFDEARNAGLARCRGAWILYIDADERVGPIERAALAPLADPRLVACRVPFRPRVGFTAYAELRLFRNHPELRFQGRIHETIVPAVEGLCARTGAKIGFVPLPIEHLGYEGDLTPKHRRNLPLLRAAVAENPGRLFLWSDLARAAAALGEIDEAVAAWRHAMMIAERADLRGGSASLPFIDWLAFRFERGEPIEPDVEQALRRFPGNVPLRWLLGRERIRQGRHAEALAVLEPLVTAAGADDDLAFDARLLGVLPVELIAVCHFHLGDHAQAVRWFQRALAEDPDNLALRAKLAIATARAPGG